MILTGKKFGEFYQYNSDEIGAGLAKDGGKSFGADKMKYYEFTLKGKIFYAIIDWTYRENWVESDILTDDKNVILARLL